MKRLVQTAALASLTLACACAEARAQQKTYGPKIPAYARGLVPTWQYNFNPLAGGSTRYKKNTAPMPKATPVPLPSSTPIGGSGLINNSQRATYGPGTSKTGPIGQGLQNVTPGYQGTNGGTPTQVIRPGGQGTGSGRRQIGFDDSRPK